MSQNIQALNTEWNRKTNMLEGAGKVQLLDTHNGIAYFTWTDLERGTLYLQCEEGFFHKNFKVTAPKPLAEGESVKPEEKPDLKKFKFKKYPFDLVK